MPHRNRFRGFTLIEVIVALMISALVLLSARALLLQLSESSHAVVTSSRSADDEHNSRGEIRRLMRQVEANPRAGFTFDGTERQAQFSSWCTVPAGWEERCRVVLALDGLPGQESLTARASINTPVIFHLPHGANRLLYLDGGTDGTRWYRTWEGGVTAPLAIGVITDRDTLILVIGRRG